MPCNVGSRTSLNGVSPTAIFLVQNTTTVVHQRSPCDGSPPMVVCTVSPGRLYQSHQCRCERWLSRRLAASLCRSTTGTAMMALRGSRVRLRCGCEHVGRVRAAAEESGTPAEAESALRCSSLFAAGAGAAVPRRAQPGPAARLQAAKLGVFRMAFGAIAVILRLGCPWAIECAFALRHCAKYMYCLSHSNHTRRRDCAAGLRRLHHASGGSALEAARFF
jgi:hypothetical protein